MTWLSRTCFSILLTAQVQAGIVAGEFELTGSREASVVKLKDYSGVVVWLESERTVDWYSVSSRRSAS